VYICRRFLCIPNCNLLNMSMSYTYTACAPSVNSSPRSQNRVTFASTPGPVSDLLSTPKSSRGQVSRRAPGSKSRMSRKPSGSPMAYNNAPNKFYDSPSASCYAGSRFSDSPSARAVPPPPSNWVFNDDAEDEPEICTSGSESDTGSMADSIGSSSSTGSQSPTSYVPLGIRVNPLHLIAVVASS
jgi:hypothetical protein